MWWTMLKRTTFLHRKSPHHETFLTLHKLFFSFLWINRFIGFFFSRSTFYFSLTLRHSHKKCEITSLMERLDPQKKDFTIHGMEYTQMQIVSRHNLPLLGHQDQPSTLYRPLVLLKWILCDDIGEPKTTQSSHHVSQLQVLRDTQRTLRPAPHNRQQCPLIPTCGALQ